MKKTSAYNENDYLSFTDETKKQAYSLFCKSNVPQRHRKIVNRIDHPWWIVRDELMLMLGVGCIAVLVGVRGSGKTKLSSEAIRLTCKMLKTSKYCKAIEIFLELRESMKERDKLESDVVYNFCKPDLLVIDAMEERGQTEWEDRMLNHIIDKRYDNFKDTILISNQTKETFSKSLGNSIVSRISETGKVFECTWESFRKYKG